MKTFEEALRIMALPEGESAAGATIDKLSQEGHALLREASNCQDFASYISCMTGAFVMAAIKSQREIDVLSLVEFGTVMFISGVRVGIEMEKRPLEETAPAVARPSLVTVEYEELRAGQTADGVSDFWFPTLETFREGRVDDPWKRAQARAHRLRANPQAHRNVSVVAWGLA